MTFQAVGSRFGEGFQAPASMNVIHQDYLPRMARIRADRRVIAAVLAKLNIPAKPAER